MIKKQFYNKTNIVSNKNYIVINNNLTISLDNIIKCIIETNKETDDKIFVIYYFNLCNKCSIYRVSLLLNEDNDNNKTIINELLIINRIKEFIIIDKNYSNFSRIKDFIDLLNIDLKINLKYYDYNTFEDNIDNIKDIENIIIFGGIKFCNSIFSLAGNDKKYCLSNKYNLEEIMYNIINNNGKMIKYIESDINEKKYNIFTTTLIYNPLPDNIGILSMFIEGAKRNLFGNKSIECPEVWLCGTNKNNEECKIQVYDIEQINILEFNNTLKLDIYNYLYGFETFLDNSDYKKSYLFDSVNIVSSKPIYLDEYWNVQTKDIIPFNLAKFKISKNSVYIYKNNLLGLSCTYCNKDL